MKKNALSQIIIFFIILFVCPFVQADQETDVAMELANPVSSLISVPVQANYDENIGSNDEGSVWRTNIQPVIPFAINEDWKVVTRTIVPVINQKNVPVKGMDESGVGDVSLSFFISPTEKTTGGYMWGAGAIFLLDTASDKTLGAEKWAAGPSGIILKQEGPWTYGVLSNHLTSFAGEDKRTDINATFVQPFVAYVTETHTTLSLTTESTYDWKGNQWSVPVNLTVAQMLKAGDQLFQVGLGVRYWAESPNNGPEDWGLRLQVTFLFIK